MAAHRYWRLLFPFQDSGSYNGATEIEFRESIDGADETGSGTASASSEFDGSYAAAKAFDNDTTNTWSTSTPANVHSWIAYDFGVGVTKDIVEVSLTSRYSGFYGQNSYDLQYSDDGTNWVTKYFWRDLTPFTGVHETRVTNASHQPSVDFDVISRGFASASMLPFVTSASSSYQGESGGWASWRAFNHSASYGWTTNGTASGWLKFDFGADNGCRAVSYSIRSNTLSENARMPKDFTFQGSNDDSSWDTLDTQTNITGWSSGETKNFSIASPATYRYYKLNVTANNGDGYLQVEEFFIFVSGPNAVQTYNEDITLAIDAGLSRSSIAEMVNAIVLALDAGQSQSGGMTFDEAITLAMQAAEARAAILSCNEALTLALQADDARAGNAEMNEGVSFGLTADVLRSNVLAAVEACAFGVAVSKAMSSGADFNEAVILAVNAIEAHAATVEMNAVISLGISAEHGTGSVAEMDAVIALSLAMAMLQAGSVDVGAQTYDEAATLAAAMGMSHTSIGNLQEAVALATAAGMGLSVQSILINALVLQATASTVQSAVGSLSASLNLDVSMSEAFGTALILQASVLLGIQAGAAQTGGLSVDEVASLGINAGMAQTVSALLSAAIELNAKAAQAQTSVLTAEARVALDVACGQIEAALRTHNLSLALSIVADMQRWGIVPRIAAARYLYNALARKRQYDATARKREYDAE